MRKVHKMIEGALHSIGAKFAVTVLLLGLLAGLTVSLVALRLRLDHNRNELDSLLRQVQQSTEAVITNALQYSHDDIIMQTIQGVAALKAVEHVSLETPGRKTFATGSIQSKKTVQYVHPVLSTSQPDEHLLGTITITAGLDRLYQKLHKGFLLTFLGAVSLAWTGSFIIFGLFHFLVGRHLAVIADHSRSIDIDSLGTPLTLNRPERAGKPDELHNIVQALNQMSSSLADTLNSLRIKEKEFESIVTASSDGIIRFDPSSRCVFANKAASKLFKIAPDAMYGQSPEELGMPAESAKRIKHTLAEVFAGRTTAFVVFELKQPQSCITIEMALTPEIAKEKVVRQVIGVMRDVTFRHQKQQVLEKAFQHMPMLMSISEISTGRFIEINQRFIETTGYSRETAVGKSSTELGFLNKEDRLRIFKELDQFGYVQNLELRLTKADGNTIDCLFFAEIIDINGQNSLLSIMQDVSDHKILKKQLNQTAKLEAIGTLAGGIAHDFNNILGAILGYGQMALEELDTKNPVSDYIHHIMHAGERAAALIRQILAFSRQDDSTLQPIALQSVIKEVLKLLRSTLPSTIELHTEVEEATDMVNGDPIQIHQVIMNICTNARQAIGSNMGNIHVALRQEKVREPFTSSDGTFLDGGDYLTIRVRDDGPGIPGEATTKLFDPFFTTKGPGVGTGLGLSITHSIVKSFNGGILVESTPGQGSVFSIYLPVIGDNPKTPTHNLSSETLKGNERILLVDDEQPLLKILQVSLKRLGYQVTSFTSSQEAFIYFSENSKDIDVVVTDMTMPELTGMDLIRSMLEVKPNQKTILCTGFSESIDEKSALAQGVNSFVLKPVIGKQVAQQIREVLNHG